MALSYASFSAIVSLSVIQSPLIKKTRRVSIFVCDGVQERGSQKKEGEMEKLDVIIHDILYLGYIYQV